MDWSPINIQVDPAEIRRLNLEFAAYPKSINRILVESINKVAGKARTDLIAAAYKLTKIPKKTIRRFTSIRKAKLKDPNPNAWVRVFSRHIPVRYMGFEQGPLVERLVPTTPKQSVWLYYNVFKPKYGKDARFKKQYVTKRMVPSFLSYKRGRKEIVLPENTFIAKFPRTGYWGAFTKGSQGPGKLAKLVEVVGPSVGEVLNENRQDVNAIQQAAMAGLNADISARIGRYIKMRNTGTLPGRKAS